MAAQIDTGFINGCNLPIALYACLDAFLELNYAMVSTIDSGPPSAMVGVLARLSALPDFQIVGRAIQMKVNLISLQAIARLLSGFDEIWFFTRQQDVEIPEFGITSEEPLTDAGDCYAEDDYARLSDWMTLSGCVIGMGDGCGLNYVASERRYIALLRERCTEALCSSDLFKQGYAEFLHARSNRQDVDNQEML